MTDKISIIIPVYNVEPYIRKCLDSVINQSYTNLEIICIDDGSTDNSSKICYEYAEKDSRIKIFHTANNGASYARNLGINNSTGLYIGFIDSDDWIEPNMYEVLYTKIKNYDVTFSIISYYRNTDKESVVMANRENIPVKTLNQQELLMYSADLDNYISFGHVIWNKLYTAEYVKKNNLTFNPNLRTAMDMLFSYEFILADSSCTGVYCDKSLYHYYQRGDSISTTLTQKYKILRLRVCDSCIEMLKKNKYTDISKYLKRFYCYTASRYVEDAIYSGDNKEFEFMQREMELYLNEYVELNKAYPDRVERIKKLLAIKI